MGSCISKAAKIGPLSIEKRINYIKETPFFQYVTEETIHEFAHCFPTNVRASPGKALTLDANKIYIVCDGEVDLSTTIPKEGAKVEAKGYLCRKRRGDIINVGSTKDEISRRMTLRSHKMKAEVEDLMTTTVGSGDAGILLLCGDMRALDDFSKAHPELSKPIVEICTSQIEDRLLTIPFLREIPKSKLSVLAAMCRYEAYDVCQTVFEEGSDADKLFLVLSGVAKVVAKSDPSFRAKAAPSEQSVALKRSFECSGDRRPLTAGVDRPYITIAELKSGDYFGETGLVFNIDRTCGVRTAEKCLFLTVHRSDFENFLKICPIEDTLKGVIKQRMVSRLSSLGIPFLNGIPEDMLASLGSSVEINEVPEGGVIFQQGDVGDRFYIVVHGSVKVETTTPPDPDIEGGAATGEVDNDEGECDEPDAGETTLGSLVAGQYFGEMSLVSCDSHLRTATVTSTQKSILLSIDKDSFQALFGHNNNVLSEFELRLLKRSAKLKHILSHSLGIVSFREFLESEHAGENIDFWVAANEFEATNGDDGVTTRRERAKHIFVTFCAEYADRQVNLPHSMLAKIDATLQSGEVARDLFDEARQEVFRLMEKDGFNRYKQSVSFGGFLSRLGIWPFGSLQTLQPAVLVLGQTLPPEPGCFHRCQPSS